MNLAVIIIAVFIILLCGIVFFGAPFVPTKKAQIAAALELLRLKKGQLLYDLGAGDGRVALAAAKQGIQVEGYELNILLVLHARFRTRKYSKLVKIHWQNYWTADFSKCDGVFIFSSSRFMAKLDKKLRGVRKGVKLASFAFGVPGKKYKLQKDGIFLYEY